MRRAPPVLLAFLLLIGFAACTHGPAPTSASLIAVPTQSPPPSVGTPVPCMAALIDGDLVADATYGIALDDLHTHTRRVRKVIWPYGFVAARDGDRLALLDGAGQIVAHEGDRVQLGGGEISSDGPWLACGGITVVHRSN
jgi:hypothetical protein